ncbi:GNAT family N-acetyltransferase [Lysinibacillus xylanilyticus]|uniref:GNAT family N-acetyltransferase n=1 Tax=Lysinibacillus xylanilyticus TaxID=582475 RepID=UPI0037F5209A
MPTVADVKALGNKTLSVKFSEPVKNANTNNFTVDGKPVVGEVKVNGNNVIVKLYTSLEDGEHTVAVKDVTDFADFKSLNSEHKFNVVKDVTAPTLSSVEKATFEKVTIKFSEQVDPDTVTTSSAYWLQGTSKKYPTAVTQISDDTFEFDFSNNKIQYTTDLYVTGVKDYSSNLDLLLELEIKKIEENPEKSIFNVLHKNGEHIIVYLNIFDQEDNLLPFFIELKVIHKKGIVLNRIRLSATYKSEDIIEIGDIEVFGENEGRGYGTILLQSLINFAIENSVHTISGWISHTDKEHFDKLDYFYKKHGFDVIWGNTSNFVNKAADIVWTSS